jgi:hypothetical protein
MWSSSFRRISLRASSLSCSHLKPRFFQQCPIHVCHLKHASTFFSVRASSPIISFSFISSSHYLARSTNREGLQIPATSFRCGPGIVLTPVFMKCCSYLYKYNMETARNVQLLSYKCYLEKIYADGISCSENTNYKQTCLPLTCCGVAKLRRSRKYVNWLAGYCQ